jgi:hypothetical protein
MTKNPRDLRRYSRQTTIRLLAGGILLFYLVGGGLIYWLYGSSAMVSGLLCLTAGLAPLVLIWAFLGLMGWIAKKANQD